MNARISSSPACTSPPLPSAAKLTPELPVSGLTPFTTLDFPGRLAAVLYTQGCSWRCRYCHNAHLWPFGPGGSSFDAVLRFLETRRGLLDGVVFCGGEPTAHPELAEAIRTVRAMGFEAALHTAGMYPENFEEVLPLCDWVGMDIKAPFDAYPRITGVPDSGKAARHCAHLLVRSGVEHEFRTTVHPALLTESDILSVAGELSAMGAQTFVLQAFRPRGEGGTALDGPGLAVSESLRSALSLVFSRFFIRS